MVFGFHSISKIDDDSLDTQVYHEIPRTDLIERSNETIYVEHGLPIIRPTLETLLIDAALFQQQHTLPDSSFGMNQPPQGVSLFSRINDALSGVNDENANENEMLGTNSLMVDQPIERQVLRRNSLREIVVDALDMSVLEDDHLLPQQ